MGARCGLRLPRRACMGASWLVHTTNPPALGAHPSPPPLTRLRPAPAAPTPPAAAAAGREAATHPPARSGCPTRSALSRCTAPPPPPMRADWGDSLVYMQPAVYAPIGGAAGLAASAPPQHQPPPPPPPPPPRAAPTPASSPRGARWWPPSSPSCWGCCRGRRWRARWRSPRWVWVWGGRAVVGCPPPFFFLAARTDQHSGTGIGDTPRCWRAGGCAGADERRAHPRGAPPTRLARPLSPPSPPPPPTCAHRCGPTSPCCWRGGSCCAPSLLPCWGSLRWLPSRVHALERGSQSPSWDPWARCGSRASCR